MTSDAEPLFDETITWEDAQAELEARAFGDGLPLVPPTPSRLAAMLQGVAAADRSFGQLPPLFGDLTPQTIAYQCVLAGCQPGYLKIVMTAIAACLEPQFNLLGLMTTTGTPAVAVILQGPICQALGLNSQTNCLGPGNRANACIGRAVSLVLRNIGGARENIGDMATMGQPGKYTFCFAENADGLLPPLSARRGYEKTANMVTVLGVSGTAEVLPAAAGDQPEDLLHPLALAMVTAISLSGRRRKTGPQEQFFLLPPELAHLLDRHHWDLARIQEFLLAAAAELGPDERPAIAAKSENIHPIVTGGAGIKMTYLPLWAGGSLSVSKPLL